MRFLALLALVSVALAGCGDSTVDESTTPRKPDSAERKPTGEESKLTIQIGDKQWGGVRGRLAGVDAPAAPPGVAFVYYTVRNGTDKPLKSFDVEFECSIKGTPYKETIKKHVDKFFNMCESTENLLLPGHKTAMAGLYIELAVPKAQIGGQIECAGKVTLIEPMEVTDDFTDEHQVEWLMYEGNLDRIKKAVTAQPSLLKFKNTPTLTPILMASMGKSVEVLKYLESAGAKLDETTGAGETALHFAAFSTPEMIDYVSLKGVASTRERTSGANPLCYAIQNDNVEGIKALVRAGCPIKEENYRSFTPLMMAVRWSTPEVVSACIAAGADVKKPYDNQYGPLTMAAVTDQIEIVKVLIKAGLSVKTVNQDGSTALHQAVKYNLAGMAKWLVSQGADANAKDANGETPIDLANQSPSQQGQEDLLAALGSK